MSHCSGFVLQFTPKATCTRKGVILSSGINTVKVISKGISRVSPSPARTTRLRGRESEEQPQPPTPGVCTSANQQATP